MVFKLFIYLVFMVSDLSIEIPIRLESSENFIAWPDGSFNKINLINLLNDAYSKGLSGKQKIIACQRVPDPELDCNNIDKPQDEFYIDKKRIFSHEQLNKFYRSLEGAVEDYSPKAEKERYNFVMFARERIGYINAIGKITYRDVIS